MARASYAVDVSGVEDFEDFVEAVNVGFVRRLGEEWTGNLDALNDFLVWPAVDSYDLVLLGSNQCAARLDHAAMELHLRAMLATCHPLSREHVEERRRLAELREGPTLFDLLREILAGCPMAKLSLR